jgi:hypothetical protein
MRPLPRTESTLQTPRVTPEGLQAVASWWTGQTAEGSEDDMSQLPDQNVEAVRHKLAERAKRGLAKYGVTTERTDLTELQWLQHAQDELLDGAVYLEKLIQLKKG